MWVYASRVTWRKAQVGVNSLPPLGLAYCLPKPGLAHIQRQPWLALIQHQPKDFATSILEIEQTNRCCSETESVTVQICSGLNQIEPHTQSMPAAADDQPLRMVVGDVGGHPEGSVRNFKSHCDRCVTELKLVLFACGGWHGGTLSSTEKGKKERKSIYIAPFIYYVYLKALRHGSHSFTCKYAIPAFPS